LVDGETGAGAARRQKGRSLTTRYAGAWIRLAAIAIDVVVLAVFFFPVTRLAKGVWLMSTADHRWANGLLVTDPLCLVFLAVMFIYFVVFEWLVGATPGKLAAGLRVVGEGGGRPTMGQAALRNVLRMVDGLPAVGVLALVLISSSAERARFGDRVAGTRIVRSRRRD
jgi:uncharacterized RDD family membrane protein YckC